MTDQQLGVMGQYLREYKPVLLSPHGFVNDLVGPAPVRAFPQGAIVVQQKQIPDVSFWQGLINYELMSLQTDALIIRAGQNKWADTQFRRNWLQARIHNILRGSYWFYDDRVSPGEQAKIWADLLRDDPPEMEIWCDWENSYGGQFGGLRNVVAFMERVEELLPGIDIGLYTGYWWFREHSNVVTNASQYNYLKRKKLFLAWYTLIASQVLIPAPWSEIFLWQFGTPAVGREYGVETEELDMSYINMTEVEFKLKYTGVVVPPPVGEEPMPTTPRYEAINLGDNMALRNAPHTDNVAIERFPAGTRWEGDAIFEATEIRRDSRGNIIQFVGDTWLRVIRVNGDPSWIGYVAIIHKGEKYCDLEDRNPTVPTPTPPAGLPSTLYIGTRPDGSDVERFDKAS